MKMVASAKLHKAQGAIENMLPYQRKLNKIPAVGIKYSHLIAELPGSFTVISDFRFGMNRSFASLDVEVLGIDVYACRFQVAI